MPIGGCKTNTRCHQKLEYRAHGLYRGGRTKASTRALGVTGQNGSGQNGRLRTKWFGQNDIGLGLRTNGIGQNGMD